METPSIESLVTELLLFDWRYWTNFYCDSLWLFCAKYTWDTSESHHRCAVSPWPWQSPTLLTWMRFASIGIGYLVIWPQPTPCCRPRSVSRFLWLPMIPTSQAATLRTLIRSPVLWVPFCDEIALLTHSFLFLLSIFVIWGKFHQISSLLPFQR